MTQSIKNLSAINDSIVETIANYLNLKRVYSVVILVNPDMDKFGDIQFAFKEQICFISLKDENDLSTLAHEMRHLWQMEQLGAEEYEALYSEEMNFVGYEQNILEVDAFEWEQNFMQLYLRSRVA